VLIWFKQFEPRKVYKGKEKKSVDIFISAVCEEAVSISDRVAPGDWMSELNWKSLRTQW
jgi:hypothetical protein